MLTLKSIVNSTSYVFHTTTFWKVIELTETGLDTLETRVSHGNSDPKNCNIVASTVWRNELGGHYASKVILNNFKLFPNSFESNKCPLS